MAGLVKSDEDYGNGSGILNSFTTTNVNSSGNNGEGGGGGNGFSNSSGTSFSGIEDPALLAILKSFINDQVKGGSADYQQQRGVRNAQRDQLISLLGDYSNEAAFSDAAQLMQLNLQQSLEKQMPVIARSVQGAGTSASSMQGLLSSKLATDSALAAGALGADQAKAYAGAMAALQGTLERYTTIDNTVADNLIKGLDLSRTSRSSQTSHSEGPSRSSEGREGSMPIRSSGGGNNVPQQPYYRVIPDIGVRMSGSSIQNGAASRGLFPQNTGGGGFRFTSSIGNPGSTVNYNPPATSGFYAGTGNNMSSNPYTRYNADSSSGGVQGTGYYAGSGDDSYDSDGEDW